MSPTPSSVAAADAIRPLALALDAGTSSVRAALYDAKARLIKNTLVRSRYHWTTEADGGVRTDASRLIGRIDDVLDRLVERCGPQLRDVEHAGISTFFHSFCGVDAAHRAITPLLSWADTSTEAAAERLKRSLDPTAIHQRTGAPLHPGYWPSRIAAFSARGVSAAAWAGLPELLLEHLTGEWCVGLSLAAGTGLLNRHADAWDDELLTALDVRPGQLAPIQRGHSPVGPLRGAAADRWPALAHVTWFAPVGDGACGNVGLGCIGPERAALMIGTSSALRVMVSGQISHVPDGLFAYRTEDDRTLLGGALSEGGGLPAWWARTVGRSLDDLNHEAESRPAGDVTVLPYLTGERGPGYHGEARAVIGGLRPEDDAAAIFRAMLTSVSISLGTIDRRLGEALAEPPRITASGGGLDRSRLWRQLVADAIGRPIDVARIGEPSLRGAAILALGLLGRAAAPATHEVVPEPDGVERLQRAAVARGELYRRVLDD